jgi:hypothetical protein
MSATEYSIDIRALSSADEEISQNNSRLLLKGKGQGIAGRLKSKDETDGHATELDSIETFYGHGSFRGHQKRFGQMLECMRLESQTSDSQSKIQLAIQLIAETLQELQNLIRGDFFIFADTDSQTETGSNDSSLPEATIPQNYPAESSADRSVAEIADMLQYIEEMSPGFIDSLKGSPDMNAVDSSESGQALLLELLEELFEQIDLAIGRIAADDSSGQAGGINTSQAMDDEVVNAIEGFKERISGQINQIEAISPGFSNAVRPFVEGDLDDGKESGSGRDLQDALEELSEVLEDLVTLLKNNAVDNNLQVKGLLQGDAEGAALSQKAQQDEGTEVPSNLATAPEKNIPNIAPDDTEPESGAVETFMVIYDQLSAETKSEVAQILVSMTFDEEITS